jgi:hypothetical protein
MSLASSKNTSCAFNAFIQSLPFIWSLPSTLEGSKNCNSAETCPRTEISPTFMSDQPHVPYWQTIWEADFEKIPKALRKESH